MNGNKEGVTAVSFGAGAKDAIGPDLAAAELFRDADIEWWQGTSMGGFVALMMANGFSHKEMVEAMHDLWHPSLRRAVRAIAPKRINPFKLLRGDQEELRKLFTYVALLDQLEHVTWWIEKYKLEWKNARFVLFDLISRKLVIVDATTGISLAASVAATMAVPVLFGPQPWVEANGAQRLFVDGGMRHMYPTVEGHKTAIVKTLRFPFSDMLFKDTAGDVLFDIGVVPGAGIFVPPSRKEIAKQVRAAQQRLREMGEE